jgi:hypothetical protein
VAAIRVTSQAIWLKRILEDMRECQQGSTTILYDNKPTITMMENHVFHSRTKHISIKYYFLREAVDNKKIDFEYCRTKEQLANIFTKAYPQFKFKGL